MVQKNSIISNPNVSVDCVVFGFDGADLKVLLVERYGRDNLDFQDDTLVLPGDLINNHEDLNEAASRVLYDLTGLTKIFLQQIGAFGSPKRLSKPKDIAWLDAVRMNPEARVITIGYYALINIKNYKVRVKLFNKLKDLGFKIPSIISPHAYISKHAIIGQGTIVMHGATINAGALIGKNCIINTNPFLLKKDRYAIFYKNKNSH